MSLSTDLSTSIPQGRSTFVIFVHFGDEKITNAALSSLYEGNVRPDHVIVINHADTAFRPAIDGVRVYVEENTGYIGGLESGLVHARALGAKADDLCLFVNNDVLFFKNSLSVVLQWWEAHGGSHVLAGASRGYVSLFTGRALITSTEKTDTAWRILYIHGSCIVSEFGFLASLPLATPLFMYWEDVLLSMVVHRRGGALRVIPGLHIVHDDTEGVPSSSKVFYLVRNGAYVLERYSPPLWRIYWYGVNTIRWVYHVLGGMKHKHIAKALYDARMGRLGRLDV